MQWPAILGLGTMTLCVILVVVETASENCEWLATLPQFDKSVEGNSSLPPRPPKDDDKRLVQFNMHEGQKWMTWKELEQLHAQGGLINYIDLTDSAHAPPEKKSDGFRRSGPRFLQ